MKEFFQKIEWNDLRAVITLLNVILIIFFQTTVAWLGLAVAFLGLCKDIFVDRKANGAVIHFANILLNICILCNLI